MKLIGRIFGCTIAVVWVSSGWAADSPAPQAEPPKDAKKVIVPKLWDDRLLATWALPIAGLNITPNHIPASEYYAAPIDNLRTYPVYHPDYEPKGYQEWLKQQPPKPVIEPDQLKNEQDWLEAGRRVFDELDVPITRTDDPKALGYLRDREALKKDGTSVDKGGVILGYRWVVEKPGQVRLSFSECSGCHVRLMPDGSTLRGAPGNIAGGGDAAAVLGLKFNEALGKEGKPASPGEADYLASAVPWAKDEEPIPPTLMQKRPHTPFIRVAFTPFSRSRLSGRWQCLPLCRKSRGHRPPGGWAWIWFRLSTPERNPSMANP